MMKFKYYLLSALLLLSVSSCKKFLDREPQDFLDPEAYYETEAQLNYALNGIYDVLGNSSLYGTAYPSRIGMEADEGAYKDNSLLVGPQVYDFSTSDNYVSNLWKVLYEGIGRANYLLARVDKNKDLTEALRKRVRGEATFLRAYYYFLLVQHFGNIPLVLEPTTTSPENPNLPQSPAKDVYDYIIADMELAEGLVDPITKANNGGRVSKSAVRGILARVCLYNAGYPVNDKTKYAKAKYWAEQVINDNVAEHRLNSSYADIFTNYAKDKYDAQESIWEVEFYGNTSGTYRETGTLGAWLGIPSNNAGVGTAYGFITVNRTLWDKYEAPVLPATTSPDLRREWNIAGFTYNATTGLPVNNSGSAPVIYWQKFPGKYRRVLEAVVPKANNSTPINYPLLRFSDVLLMYAEAENEISGPSQDIIDKVNLVRQRGYGFAPDAVNANSANLTAEETNSYLDFAQAIRDERSRELCFEGLRKPDLIRWGLFVPTMKSVLSAMNNDLSGNNLFKTLAFKNVKEKHVVFPIPAREMQLNKSLVQNANW
jgi:hypothetical protein